MKKRIDGLLAQARRLYHHYHNGGDVSRICIDLGSLIKGLEKIQKAEMNRSHNDPPRAVPSE